MLELFHGMAIPIKRQLFEAQSLSFMGVWGFGVLLLLFWLCWVFLIGGRKWFFNYLHILVKQMFLYEDTQYVLRNWLCNFWEGFHPFVKLKVVSMVSLISILNAFLVHQTLREKTVDLLLSTCSDPLKDFFKDERMKKWSHDLRAHNLW